MKLAVCCIVKDERRDFAEWIAFHQVIGFDTVIVYDNGSTDGTTELVRMAARSSDVRLVDWPVRAPSAQGQAYTHCLKRFGREFDWIAFIDSDEFLTPMTGSSVRPLFCTPWSRNADAIALNWAIFGSAGHDAFPDGLVIDNFTRRSAASFEPNTQVKSIVRPEMATYRSPHQFRTGKPYRSASGAPMAWSTPGRRQGEPDYADYRVNHYFTRSRAHWRAKMARGYRDLERADDMFHACDRNEVEDASATRFSPAVRGRLPVQPVRRPAACDAPRASAHQPGLRRPPTHARRGVGAAPSRPAPPGRRARSCGRSPARAARGRAAGRRAGDSRCARRCGS
jgi:hypothetical protein